MPIPLYKLVPCQTLREDLNAIPLNVLDPALSAVSHVR